MRGAIQPLSQGCPSRQHFGNAYIFLLALANAEKLEGFLLIFAAANLQTIANRISHYSSNSKVARNSEWFEHV